MFDFIKRRKIFGFISLALILITVVGAIIFKIDVDITFRGGTMLTYSYSGDLSLSEADSTIESSLGQAVNITSKLDNAIGKTTFVASLAAATGISSEQQTAVTDALQKAFPDNALNLEQSIVVNPTIGGEFFSKCLVALGFAIIVLLIYIGIRFKKIGGWATGISAIIALVHDVIMVFFAALIFDLPIDANIMAVILTILGYSINDTIVIFDRLRENKRLLPRDTTDAELLNVSLNQTFRRCLITSITTIIAMIVVTVVAVIADVDSILTFSIPMIVGLVSGSYSSICITAVIWPGLNKLLSKTKKKKA
jgi:preprotein translocase SecF subunit